MVERGHGVTAGGKHGDTQGDWECRWASAAQRRALGEHFAHCEWPVAVLLTVFVALYAPPVLDLNSAGRVWN